MRAVAPYFDATARAEEGIASRNRLRSLGLLLQVKE